MNVLKLNVSDILRPRINGKQLKKVEWWSQDKERQRPRKEGCTDQRPVPPVTCQAAHLLSLFYLSATLTLTAPRYSPFTLFLKICTSSFLALIFFFSWPFLTFFSLLLQLPDSSFQDTGSQVLRVSSCFFFKTSEICGLVTEISNAPRESV